MANVNQSVEERNNSKLPTFVDLKTDFGFKTVLGRESSKSILLEFFKQLIPEERIMDITYIDKEFKGRTEESRGCVFDVYCETEDGRRILVEMQQSVYSSFLSRSVFYATFPIQDMIKKNARSFDFAALYVISILSAPCRDFRDCDEMITNVQLRTHNTNKVVVPQLRFIYVELPKFRKTLQESVGNMLDSFLYTIKHISEMDEKPAEMYNQVLTDLFEAAKTAKMTADEQRMYYKVMTTEIDIREGLDESFAEGMEKGLKEGIGVGKEEGIGIGEKKKTLELAKAMKQKGLSSDDIAEITGLSLDIIADL